MKFAAVFLCAGVVLIASGVHESGWLGLFCIGLGGGCLGLFSYLVGKAENGE